ALIRRGINCFRIIWIDYYVGDAGVLADVEDLVPGFAAVGRLVQAAVSAWSPQRPLRRHVNNVRIFRIDRDPPDVLGIFQANILPTLAAVIRTIQAAAVRDAALAVVLAGA